MTKKRKYFNVLGERIPAGTFIGYNGSSLVGCDVIEKADKNYINLELDECVSFGNIWTNDMNEITEKAVQWLVGVYAIGHEEMEEQRQSYIKEIEEFKINNNQ